MSIIHNSKFIIQNSRGGQVMILSVMTLGGILLSGASIAGLLMLYQIRAANDVVSSAKAVFAADAGIEMVSWCALKGGSVCSGTSPLTLIFDDSTVSSSPIYQTVGSEIIITSRGYGASGRAIRILETIFETGP